MKALYIHIPFCKQACHYCDFHFSTSLAQREALTRALLEEMRLQANFFEQSGPLQSVYFGGGTPSLLPAADLAALLARAEAVYGIAPDAEITLEANPDDLNAEKLKSLKALGINRLSIGIQSFHEPHLRWTNRAHNARQALDCVPLARAEGFANLTIDLMYGLPHPDHSVLETDLQTALGLQVPHISAYCLTIEPRTAFGNWTRKGKMATPDERFAAEQFERVVRRLTAHGYEHYEVSNFALPGRYSRHNSNYWKQGHYLGLGPSAHSYNGRERWFNPPNNALYIRQLQISQLPAEREVLTRENHINEYIMTSLRTQWGCDTRFLQTHYQHNLLAHSAAALQSLQQRQWLTISERGIVCLTLQGKLWADDIAAELFVEAE